MLQHLTANVLILWFICPLNDKYIFIDHHFYSLPHYRVVVPDPFKVFASPYMYECVCVYVYVRAYMNKWDHTHRRNSMMGVSTSMNQAFISSHPLATMQGLWTREEAEQKERAVRQKQTKKKKTGSRPRTMWKNKYWKMNGVRVSQWWGYKQYLTENSNAIVLQP